LFAVKFRKIGKKVAPNFFFLYPKYKFDDKEIDTPAMMDEVAILSVEGNSDV